MHRRSGWGDLVTFSSGLLRRVPLSAADWKPDLPACRSISLPDGQSVLVRDTYDGGRSAPVVVLLHGWTWTMDATFFGLYETLSTAYRVIAFNQRGHGPGSVTLAKPQSLTDLADDVIRVLDALDISQAIIAGYSLGGAVAMQTAAGNPERIRGLSVHAAILNYRQVMRDRLVWPILRATGATRQPYVAAAVARRLFGKYAHEPDFADRWTWIRNELSQVSHDAIVAVGDTVSRFDMRQTAGHIRCPASFLIPTSDQIALPWLQVRAAEALRASIFTVIGDHHLPLIHPQRYALTAAAAIKDVVDRL